jgi:2-C-methyl-D-erythritol 4-phosphate cytidylyltransferase
VTTVAGILVGAGSGERLGAGGPKALVEVGGAPLLVHAARALVAAATVDRLVVVVPEDVIARVRTLLDGVVAPGLLAVCAGGATREASVRAGLAAAGPDVDVVAVHDTARPLVTPALVDRTVRALVDPWSAVAPALPVVDTLKLADGERVLKTVDRRALYGVQTPQVFARLTLARVHDRLGESGAATDDLVLVERAGGRVRLVEGERRNLKVTYPEDLAVVSALLAAEAA